MHIETRFLTVNSRIRYKIQDMLHFTGYDYNINDFKIQQSLKFFEMLSVNCIIYIYKKTSKKILLYF